MNYPDSHNKLFGYSSDQYWWLIYTLNLWGSEKTFQASQFWK